MHRLLSLRRRFIHSKKKPSGLLSLEINYLLVRLASAMVSGFGVIYLYNLGVDFRSGLLWILAFYIGQRLVVAGSLNKLAILVQKIGYRKLMLVSVVLMALKLWFLSISSVANWGYLVGAFVVGGLSLAGYTIVFHGMFLDDNDDEKIGEQMGTITTLGRMAGIIAPFFAGLLIEQFGFSVMFLVAMMLLLVSSVPLWMMPKHKHKKNSYSLKKVKKLIGEHKLFSWSVFLWFISDAIQWSIWPIYMYLILKSYTVFGAIGSLVMILNSVAVYVSGKMYDKRPLEKVFPAFSLAVAISWVMRFLSKDIISVATSDAINRFFSPFWWMKIRRDELGIGEKYDSVVFSVAHEYIVTFSYIFTLILSVGLLYLFERFEVLIIITVLSTLLASRLLLTDRKKFL